MIWKLGSGGWKAKGVKGTESVVRWKYRVVEYKVKGGIISTMHTEKDYLSELNALGGEGWELVEVIPFTEHQGRLARIHLILKKPE